MSTIILQRYANREYRLTHQNLYPHPPRGGDKYKEKQAEKYAIAARDTYVLQQELIQGESAWIHDGHLERREFGEVDARLGLRSLDIINEFQTVQNKGLKGGWGKLSKPTKFTKNARHRLLEAGAVVDAACGLNAWEVTLTLPGSGNERFRALAAHTGWIMNELTQLIRRAKCRYWFYVWEYQKRGALHLHILVSDPERDLLNLAKKIESRWWALLQLLSSRLNLDLFRKSSKVTWKSTQSKWQSHVAKIQKSVAAYFSKYASKACSAGRKKNGFQMVGTPSRWWGSSQQVKKDIMAARLKLTWEVSPSTAKKVFCQLEEFLKVCPQIKSYSYDFDLGVTANGTALGGGIVSINYYSSDDFKRMQHWEEYYQLKVAEILEECGYAPLNKTGWTEQDYACPTPYKADLQARQAVSPPSYKKTRTPPPPPHSQPSSDRRKLRIARGTQPQAALAIRARLVQFLAGGGGGVPTKEPDNILQLPIPGLTNPLTPY